MRLGKLCQLGSLDISLQLVILKLSHLATLSAYHVMMGYLVITLLILRGRAKLMLDDQMRIHEQDNGIV